MAVVVATLEAYARRSPPVSVPLRVARPTQTTVVIDLGRPDGGCVVIDPSGWRSVEHPPEPVMFRRTLLTMPLPEPEAGEDVAALQDLLNVADADWPLLLSWMVAALLEDVPTPILLLSGEQGTGKSTTAKLLAMLLDPSGAPLRSPPRNMEDWAVAAAGSWVVVLDNLSRIDERLMDALCRAVTGDALVRRALYTNSDVSLLAFRRKVALTAIDPGALRGDLVERLLVIDLARITSNCRRTEAEIMETFEDLHPRLLGGLLDLLATVLAVLPAVRVPAPPQMADFAHIAAAVDQVLESRALELYVTRSREIAADVLDTDPVLGAVRRLVDTCESWSGPPAQLLKKLEGEFGNGDLPKGWPTTPAALGKRLRNASRALEAIGIDLRVARDRPGRTYALDRLHPEAPGS